MKYTHNYMKIFLDTADTELIHKYHRTGLIDGITTNPTLIMKSGRNPEDVYQEIKDIGIKDISMEVVGDEGQMYCEGKRLYEKFGDVCTVKVPCTREGLAVCKSLSDQNIRVNAVELLILDRIRTTLSQVTIRYYYLTSINSYLQCGTSLRVVNFDSLNKKKQRLFLS